MTPGKPTGNPPVPINEIIEALHTLRTTCKKYNNCETCPLRTMQNECGVFYNSQGDPIASPLDWNIITPQTPYRILLH